MSGKEGKVGRSLGRGRAERKARSDVYNDLCLRTCTRLGVIVFWREEEAMSARRREGLGLFCRGGTEQRQNLRFLHGIVTYLPRLLSPLRGCPVVLRPALGVSGFLLLSECDSSNIVSLLSAFMRSYFINNCAFLLMKKADDLYPFPIVFLFIFSSTAGSVLVTWP